mgnify:CR=1 FL=1
MNSCYLLVETQQIETLAGFEVATLHSSSSRGCGRVWR